MDCKIYPSINISNIFLICNLSFSPEEIIIFEEDERNKIENLNNLSENLSKILKLPNNYLKLMKNNEFSFEKLVELFLDIEHLTVYT